MELPKGDLRPKKHLKGDLAHPVPPPSLPGQGRERRKRKRAERRRGARGGANGSKGMAIEVRCNGKRPEGGHRFRRSARGGAARPASCAPG